MNEPGAIVSRDKFLSIESNDRGDCESLADTARHETRRIQVDTLIARCIPRDNECPKSADDSSQAEERGGFGRQSRRLWWK